MSQAESLEGLLRASLLQGGGGHGAQRDAATPSSEHAGPETPPTARLISATRIAAIIGVAPKSWKASALTVWRELVLGVEPKRTAAERVRLERGNRREAIVRGLYLQESGATLVPQREVHVHPVNAWATCSPDSIVDVDGERRVVDLKTWSRWQASKFGLGPADIPAVYLTQLAWSMYVLGLEASELYVAFGEDADDAPHGFSIQWTRRYVVRRDAELEVMLVQAGERFWTQHVLTRRAP